jgi:hypothetical protein
LDTQRTGRIFGWFFIGTFVTSIPARLLFVDGLGASWDDMRFVPESFSETSLRVGALLEFGLIIANIATAVVLYPLAKRWSETLSLGYVTARVMESAIIAVGLMSILSVIDVSDALTGAGPVEAAALTIEGNSLVNTYEWAFLFGPGFVVPFGNGLILGFLMYRSGLVPPRMAMLGLVGGPLLFVSSTLILFDVYDNGPGVGGLLALPEIAWEASLGIYAAWKGFRPVPIPEPEMATS